MPKVSRYLRKVPAHPDFWYPVAWSDEIKPGKVIGRHFAGDPIALYRTADGKVAALEDRCAHRQVPLHMGVVNGQTLKCGYHGWAYDTAGACVDVPYLGKCLLANSVKSYPVIEMNGLVLVFPGDVTLSLPRQPALLGSVAELMEQGAHVLTRSQVMDGIAEMIPDIQVEATFPDGTKLVTVHEPIR